MTSPFVEAQQFKGVFPDPAKVALAQTEKDPELKAKLLARPAFDGTQSMYFKNGKAFDVQEDHLGQYLVLDAETPAGQRPRVNVGEWICLLQSGRFVKFTDAEYKAMTA